MPASVVTNASFHLGATPEAVHDLLSMARANLQFMDVEPDLLGNAEVVIAEVLNNIVEHAYAGAAPTNKAEIQVDLMRRKRGLAMLVLDHGRPMPNLQLPQGSLPNADGPVEDLPEGGFGWFIIRELSRGLQYRRIGNVNRLRLLIPKPAGEEELEAGAMPIPFGMNGSA
ncbi:MAG: ATP-binding protein [Mangrovicoccus sp.]|nr:ATP-binding protein [Mangrovicoccus sp.]